MSDRIETNQAQQAVDAGQGAEPGDKLANPAQPYATTTVPERAEASAFLQDAPATPPGYPKIKYHPVHGGVTVNDAGEEAGLLPKTDWFDSAELADAARTWTEAEAVRVHNQQAKLKELLDKGLPVIRNSVQADEAIRRSQAEPL